MSRQWYRCELNFFTSYLTSLDHDDGDDANDGHDDHDDGDVNDYRCELNFFTSYLTVLMIIMGMMVKKMIDVF